jgi:isochorismate hydrolase
VNSVVSLRTFANGSNVPIVVLVDMQHEYVAERRLEGFEPHRNEMIFERASPSCYACEPFSALVSQSRGGIVLAGFAGESSCLSTLIDAFHRNHKVTFLCDASASHALEDASAEEIHRAVSKISRLYADVSETDDWIASTLPRKLVIGKNAGG